MADVEDALLDGTSLRDASSANFDSTEPAKAGPSSRKVINSNSNLEIDQLADSSEPIASNGTETADTGRGADGLGPDAGASTAIRESEAVGSLGADDDLPESGDGGQALGPGDGDLVAGTSAAAAGSERPSDDALNPDAPRGSTSAEDSQMAADIAGPLKSTDTEPTAAAAAGADASIAAAVDDSADIAPSTSVGSTDHPAISSVVVTQASGATSDLGWMSVTTGELGSAVLSIDSKRDGASHPEVAPLAGADSLPGELGAVSSGPAASSPGLRFDVDIRNPDAHNGSAIGVVKRNKSVNIILPVDSAEQGPPADADADADASTADDDSADAHPGIPIISGRQTAISGVVDITRLSGVASDLPSMLSVNTSDLDWATASAISQYDDRATADQGTLAEAPSAPPTDSAGSGEILAQLNGRNPAEGPSGTSFRASLEGPDTRPETDVRGEEGAGGALQMSGVDGEAGDPDPAARVSRVPSPVEASGSAVRDSSSSSPGGGGDADQTAGAPTTTATTIDAVSVSYAASISRVDSVAEVESLAAHAARSSSQDGGAGPSGLVARPSSRDGGGGGTGSDWSVPVEQQPLPSTSRETTRTRMIISGSRAASRPTSSRPRRTAAASTPASTVTTAMDAYSGDPSRFTATPMRSSSVSSTMYEHGKRSGSATKDSSLSSVDLLPPRSAGAVASSAGQVGGASSSSQPRPESAARRGTSSSGITATAAAAGGGNVDVSGSADGGRPSSLTLRPESLGAHRRRSGQEDSLTSYGVPSAVASSMGVGPGDSEEPRVGGTLAAIYWTPAEAAGVDEEQGGLQGQDDGDDDGEVEGAGEGGGDAASASAPSRVASANVPRHSATEAWGRKMSSADGGGCPTSLPSSHAVASVPPNDPAGERPVSASTAPAALPITAAAASTYDDGLSAVMISAPSAPPALPPRHRSQTEFGPMYGMDGGPLAATAPSSFNPVIERRPTSQSAAVIPNCVGAVQRPLLPLPSAHGGMGMGVRPRSAVSAPAGDTAQRPSLSLTGLMTSSPAPGGGAASLPPRPVHQLPTRVQPKGPLDDCTTQAASEHVRSVWSTSNICGIRSLPNALSPDFRDRLYEHLAAAAKQPENRPSTDQHKPSLSYGIEGGPLAMPLSVGQKQVARSHPLSGMFTQFEYLPSEYDRVKLTGKFDRLKHKLSQTAPSEFIVRSLPQALRGAPAFSEFTYCTDPVDSYTSSMHAVTDLARSRIVAGPFYPSGRVQSARILKGRLEECMMRLCRQLTDDWPSSFLQVFEDRNGSIVASFHRGAAVLEGDLSSYMNTLAKRNHVVATYQLLKDATRWGLVDAPSQTVFYVMWPPWVRHKYLGPHAAPLSNEAVNGRSGTRNGSSSGEEEGGEGAEDGDQRITEPGWA